MKKPPAISLFSDFLAFILLNQPFLRDYPVLSEAAKFSKQQASCKVIEHSQITLHCAFTMYIHNNKCDLH